MDTTYRETVIYPAKPMPMTLVISDEASALFDADTPEGERARRMLHDIVIQGRRAGIAWQASRETVDRFPGHTRRCVRSLLGSAWCLDIYQRPPGSPANPPAPSN